MGEIPQGESQPEEELLVQEEFSFYMLEHYPILEQCKLQEEPEELVLFQAEMAEQVQLPSSKLQGKHDNTYKLLRKNESEIFRK